MQSDVCDKLTGLAWDNGGGGGHRIVWQRCARQVNAELKPGCLCNYHEVFGSTLQGLSGATCVSKQNKVRALMDNGPLAKKSNNRHFI